MFKWFSNLKIIQKLLGAFILVAFFIGLVGFIGMYHMKSIERNLDNIYNNDLIKIDYINKIKLNALSEEKYVLLAMNPNFKMGVNDFEKFAKNSITEYNSLILNYKKIITIEADKNKLEEYDQLTKRVMKLLIKYLKKLRMEIMVPQVGEVLSTIKYKIKNLNF